MANKRREWTIHLSNFAHRQGKKLAHQTNRNMSDVVGELILRAVQEPPPEPQPESPTNLLVLRPAQVERPPQPSTTKFPDPWTLPPFWSVSQN